MSIAADEVNLLVYRYLHESGFDHSAFTFGHESLLAHTDAVECDLPYGSLIGLLQKGLRYLEIEKHVSPDGTEAPHDASTTILADSSPLSATDTASRIIVGADDRSTLLPSAQAAQALCCAYSPDGNTLAVGTANGMLHTWTDLHSRAVSSDVSVAGPATPATSSSSSSSSSAAAADGAAWAVASSAADGEPQPVEPEQILCAQWSPSGRQLAAGSSGGRVLVVSPGGTCLARSQLHSAAVFAVGFSPSGTRLASCSLDGTVAVVDAEEDEEDSERGRDQSNVAEARDSERGPSYAPVARLAMHRAPVLDLAWQSETVLATCSTDGTIQLSKLGSDRAPRVFAGHLAEVNCLRWDASRSMLATGSDDSTVKLWSPRDGQVATFAGHTAAVHRVCWSSGGDGAGPYSVAPPVVASCSVDGSARVWDVNSGKCKFTLAGHRATVAAVSMSDDGSLLASASLDRRVLVWSLADGSLVHSFESRSAGVLDVSWHPSGQQLAAAYTDGTAAILQLRKP